MLVLCVWYIKASNRQYIQDSFQNSLCRLLQISAKRSRLVSVPPLIVIPLISFHFPFFAFTIKASFAINYFNLKKFEVH